MHSSACCPDVYHHDPEPPGRSRLKKVAMQPEESGYYVTELPQTGSTRSGTCKRQRLHAPAGMLPFPL